MSDPSNLLAEIRALEQSLHQPEIRTSRDALDALLAPDFVEFGASGTVYHRAGIIELLLAEDPDETSGELLTDTYVLTAISADAVLLTYRTIRRSADGSERCALRSSIWKQDGARWQMLFHQGTLVPTGSNAD